MNSSPKFLVTKHRWVFLFNLIIISFLMMSCGFFAYLRGEEYIDPLVQDPAQTPSVGDIPVINYDGWFVVGLVLDTGCNEEYNGDFNSYSRVNRVPLYIFKKFVNLTYEKTTGEKHFVVEGSGNIDVNGDLTLNYTTTFTRKLSCNGIPCEGIESGSGTYTGHWVSDLGIWEGEATGTVNVKIPNTLGNSGDNSITCSASIIRSKITRGFNDPDL